MRIIHLKRGRYIRGNDYSPVAVIIILTTDPEEIPPEIERLVRAGAESGAALSGTLQTANIGIEKVICNIVANPNIRSLVLGGPESEGHKTGDAIKALFRNGVDERNVSSERPGSRRSCIMFRWNSSSGSVTQLTLVDCQFQTEQVIRKAVWSCYQENPVDFKGQSLCDPGAWAEPPLSGKITWKVVQPWSEPQDDKERAAKQRALDMIERLKARSATKVVRRENQDGLINVTTTLMK